jgi:hypothetical protein
MTKSWAVAKDEMEAIDSLLTDREARPGRNLSLSFWSAGDWGGGTFSLSPSCGSSTICTAANLSLSAPNEPNDPIEFRLLLDVLRLRLVNEGDRESAGDVGRLLAFAGTGRSTPCFFNADRENLGALVVGELNPSESASEPEGDAALLP